MPFGLRLLSFSPGTTGCGCCGAKDQGDLQSPGWGSFGELWCRPCLYLSGKIRASALDVEEWEDLGWLEDSRDALLLAGIPTRA
ncbi:MAG TPA: hypothetical protein VMT23_00775 [Candidatus Binatia bacterium]|nr:hypothetical protein [Candidatus Binatia bacterium]